MYLRKALPGLLAVLVVAALALPAIAQETSTGTLEGKVTDDKGGSVAGATISVTGTQGLQSSRTGADGKFSVPFLKGGNYEVKVEAANFATLVIKDVEIQIGRRTTLPIQMSAGKVETVSVQAQAPMIDAKSTSIGANIKVDQFISTLPIGRTYSDTFAIAPGVVSGGGTGAGNYSISGASGLENQYIIDGVNITNTGYGGIGSYNIVYGSLGTGVTTDFLDEVQVKTGGFEAEFGGATGGILNTTVKNGTNDFGGSVGAFFTPSTTYANFKEIEFSTGSVNFHDRKEIDAAASVGGAILKDKLFYFVAYNPVRKKDRFTVTSAPFDPRFAPPGVTTFPAADLGPQERTRTSNNWAAKATWYVTPNHRLELTGFGDPSLGKGGVQNSTSLRYLDFAQGGGQSEIRYGANNFALKYNGVFTPNFFAEVQASRHRGTFRETSTLDQTRVRNRRQQLCNLGPQVPFRCPDDPATPLVDETGVASKAPTIWFTGGTGFISQADDLNDSYTAKVTNILGPVEVKYGLEYFDIRYTDEQAYSGPPIDFFIPADIDRDGVKVAGEGLTIQSNSGSLIDQRSATNFRAVRNRLNPFPGPTETKDFNAFAQATWSVNPAWTVKGGVRVTRQKISGSGQDFQLPFSTQEYEVMGDGLGNEDGICDVPRGAGGGAEVCNTDRVDVPSQAFVSSEYTFDTEFAPRAGVTWDITGDGRTKLYANVGRYFERIPNDLAVRALSTEISTVVYRFNGLGPNNTPINPNPAVNPNDAIFFNGLDPTRVQKDTQLPYKDEAILGYAYQVRPNLSLEVRGIFRKQGRTLEDVQFASNEAIQNYYYGVNYGYPSDPFGGDRDVNGAPQDSDGDGIFGESDSFPAQPFGAYVLANPGKNTPENSGYTEPEHTYRAIELILNKRQSDHWQFYANYRYSRLKGNYEGLFRNDNGQSDPNITSLFDFPNSPTMRGQYQEGFLNNDRPHVLNLYSSYSWDNGFNLGAAFTWQSGIPRTPLLAHPNYQNAGEIPGRDPIYYWWSDPAATGDPAQYTFRTGTSNDFQSDPAAAVLFPQLFDYTDCNRGCFGRTPDSATLDLHAGYAFKIKDTKLDLGIDIFNVFDSQEPISFDDNVESTAGIADPDFLAVSGYQTPRHVRFMARWAF